jgi:hypothetical protein
MRHRSFNRERERAGWYSGNAVDLYLDGSRFKSRPVHRLF